MGVPKIETSRIEIN